MIAAKGIDAEEVAVTPSGIDLHADNAQTMLDTLLPRAPPTSDTRAPVYTDYFESQRLGMALCGLHALNNALGMACLEADEMSTACDVYLQESAFEGNHELRESHELPSGWYSEAVLATALRTKDNLFVLDLDSPLKPNVNDLARVFLDTTVGVILNQNQAHWVAYRAIGGDLWFLDSTQSPLIIPLQQLRRDIAKYRHAFLVRSL